MTIVVFLLAAHAVLLALMGIAHVASGVSFGGPVWIVAAVVPVAGPVTALALVAAERMPNAGKRAADLEEARSDSADAGRVIEDTDARETVSLEDAMLVSDQDSRRELMMDVLLHDDNTSSPSLVRARSSADPEVAHYASSATMEISSGYDEALALWSMRFDERSDDLETIQRYLDVLARYMESGLAQGALRRVQESRYREVLRKKIEVDPEEPDYARLAESLLSGGLAEDADVVVAKMERLYPDEDDTWLLRMQYWYLLGRSDEIRQMVRAREGGHSSARIRAVVGFWEKVA